MRTLKREGTCYKGNSNHVPKLKILNYPNEIEQSKRRRGTVSHVLVLGRGQEDDSKGLIPLEQGKAGGNGADWGEKQLFRVTLLSSHSRAICI